MNRGTRHVPTIACMAATLVTAATILEATGWAQGALCDSEGRVCASRAIDMAADESNVDAFFVRWEVERFLGFGNPKLSDLAAWQDVPGRQREEVCALLRNVARLLRDGRTPESAL